MSNTTNRAKQLMAAREAAKHARIEREQAASLSANETEATDPTSNQAPRAYSYLPGGWNDYATPRVSSGRMLRYTHQEGDIDAKPMWWERGMPCLFDQCQGGEGNKTRRPGDNAWSMPKHIVPVNGLCLARERERDELDILVMAWRERKLG